MIFIATKKKVAFCRYHNKYMTNKDIIKKQCDMSIEGKNKIYTGVDCPYLVRICTKYWQLRDKARIEKLERKLKRRREKEHDKISVHDRHSRKSEQSRVEKR